MKKIHVAPIGHEYEVVEVPGKPPVRRVRHVHRQPTLTLCGLQVPRIAVEVALPHDHPRACQACLKRLPERPTDRVQPVMWESGGATDTSGAGQEAK